MKNIIAIFFLLTIISMSAQDTNHRQEGITVKVIDQMSQSENETESFAIEEFKALVEIQQNEIKSLKQTKSILLIIIGLLMVGFAIFYPKLIKKLK